MTGIERLRGFARRMDELSVWPGGAKLLDIAEQIERERDADVADSPYDAILPEDRDALAWVRDHGGLDHVKAEWRRRVPYDRYVRRRKRLLDHIAECETALGRRLEIISGLAHRVSDLTNENAELRKRAMPEGFMWPRYESGESVGFGDDVSRHGEDFKTDAIKLYRDGSFSPNFWAYSKGERVKRPAVLAADGEPLEVGQTVWDVNTGDEFEVCELIQDDIVEVVVEYMNCGVAVHGRVNPETLTHHRPVLDADGVPIELGDDLYSVEGSLKLHVSNIDRANCRIATSAMFALDKWADPSMFTHTKPEPPDSLERIADEIDRLREEVALHLGDYLYGEDGNVSIQFSMELVAKRCRALAERERGE